LSRMAELEARLAAFLASRMEGAADVEVSNLYRIPGGASRETWSFDASWRLNGATERKGFILRRDPDASLLETERDLEFHVLKLASDQGVRAPKPLWLESEGEWLDRPFFIMERIDGCETSAQQLISQPELAQSRAQTGRDFVDILAAIHALDWSPLVPDQLQPPELDRCGVTEIARWEMILDEDALEPQPILKAALAWLKRNQPAPAQRISLVHADYRPGNFLYDKSGRIQAMLDWEMAHLGDPLEDVGWACMRPWRWAGDEQMGALMAREEFYRLYEEASGIAIDERSVLFWEVLGNLKLAVIFITGARSFCEGRTHTLEMASLGRNINRLELEILNVMGV
jgi:aminoglycoside phosphotransferase (APT) family kinase protein